ncbi:hypothetical protein BGX21_007371 [Mortierella sp. AD011]|nr:hypothetical protein BGX20_011063 [Mortierella sp. AD010]KAF9398729.1 hypothetical protein BGX21_007371 [Mortierella sp. AD011]
MKRSNEPDQDQNDIKKPKVIQSDNVPSTENTTNCSTNTENPINHPTNTENSIDHSTGAENATDYNTANYTGDYMATMMYYYNQQSYDPYSLYYPYYYEPSITAYTAVSPPVPQEHQQRHPHSHYPTRPQKAEGTPTIRTIYIGNIPDDTTISDILDLIKTGNIESARLVAPKNCAFISFIEPAAAVAFRNRATSKPLRLGKQELKVGWGTATPVPAELLKATRQGVSRNVFIGDIDEAITDGTLLADLSRFGTIEDIKIVREKSAAFVHFTNIKSAMKAVAALRNGMRFSSYRIGYGKDRCAKFAKEASDDTPVRIGQIGSGVPMSILTTEDRRSIYLGNIPPDATCEELCNAIRGGILSKIRYLPKRHIAFVTFVDPKAAAAFLDSATNHGFTLKTRRLKVGWGEKVNTLPNEVIQAFSSGATRNVYIGGVVDIADEEKLRKDFSEFGEVEMVNILREKNCGFVNFTDVLSAVKAVKGIRNNPDYYDLTIKYGKDRCGNPPREIENMDGTKPSSAANGSNATSRRNTANTPRAAGS